MKSNKSTDYAVSPAIQRIFVYSALAGYLVTTVYEIVMATIQISSNPNLSSYYWVGVYSIILPLIFFVVAYWLSNKKNKYPVRIFASTLLATSGMFAVLASNSLVNHLIVASRSTVFASGFWGWFGLQLVIATVFLVVYVLVLLWLRRSNRF